jgi:outer membrane lipoprotein SlyB
METNKTSNRIHPLIAAAAVSVMLVSLVGVAAITGVIPTSHSSATATAVPAPTITATPITAPAPANAPVAVAASAPAPSVDAKIAADKVVNPQPKRAAAAPAPAPKSYASRETRTTQPQPRTYQYAEPAVVAQAPRICNNCGRVESVQAIQQQAQPSGLGVVAGAVLGGVLGNQVGGGNGKKLATVAGAVGGGFAGNEIERRTRSTTAYEVRVRMDNGTVRTFPYNNQPNWNIGDRIKVIDGYLTTQV